MKCCPTCGQTLPPASELNGVVLSKTRKRIYELVRRAGKYGIISDDLFDLVYQDDPNGGPENGKHVVSQHIYYMNRQLAPIGKKITAGGRGPYPHSYKLVDL